MFLSFPTLGMALEQITIRLGTLKASSWQAEEVSLSLSGLGQQSLSLILEVERLSYEKFKYPVQKLRLECPVIQIYPEKMDCPQSRLFLFNQAVLTFSFIYQGDQTIDLKLGKFNLAEGEMISQLKTLATGWKINIQINHINLEKLLTFLAHIISLPDGLRLAGEATIAMTATQNKDAQAVHLVGQFNDFTYANASGSQAGEKLIAQLDFNATSTGGKSWQIQHTLTISEGEFYSDPIYVSVTNQPISLAVEAAWQSPYLNIHALTSQQKGVMTLEGFGKLLWADQLKLEQVTAQIRHGVLKPIYQNYLKSFLGEDKEFSGTLDGRIEWGPKTRQGQVNLSHVSIQDNKAGYGFQDINGEIQWHHQRHLPSYLSWSGGQIFSHLPLGKSQIRASFNSSELKLLAPWTQPILDGAINIEQFHLENFGQPNMTWALRGQLHPISLSQLTKLFQLPPLNGQLSAQIPPIRYQNQQLSTQGAIKMRVFDGEVQIPTLHIKEPFTSKALLRADVNVNKINLETLTKVTEFGEIQGHLSGSIRDLALVNWQPVSFDAYFATPQDNTLPKKISQKAVNRLSHLGGGAAADLISRSVLKIFENFSYDQIGWGCRLQNKVCEMRGVETTGQSYYIVKGGGLPRIDVIGYNPRVDWSELLSRLKRLSQTQQPVIKK